MTQNGELCARSALGKAHRVHVSGLLNPNTFPPPPAGAGALGLESVELPALPATPELFREMTANNRRATEEREAAFENSDFLRDLKEKSEAKREQCALCRPRFLVSTGARLTLCTSDPYRPGPLSGLEEQYFCCVRARGKSFPLMI